MCVRKDQLEVISQWEEGCLSVSDVLYELLAGDCSAEQKVNAIADFAVKLRKFEEDTLDERTKCWIESK